MRLIIDDVPESLNKVLRMHWAKRKRYNDQWYVLIRAQVRPTRKKAPKMKVVISQMRRRLLDKDNLYGSVKPIVDGMRYAGIIRDDTPEWIDLDVRQQVGKVKMTVIDIEQIVH